jgi:DNA-directed RNA polymerase specialized sigma24 family protein
MLSIREHQFREFVARRRGRLIRMAALLSNGNVHRAEDLVQTVLLRMYVSWPKIRPDSRDAYAYKVLVNAHLDDQRRAYVRREVAHAEVPDVVVEASNPSPPTRPSSRPWRRFPHGLEPPWSSDTCST